MRHLTIVTTGIFIAAALISGCKSTGKAQQEDTENSSAITTPANFNADSAYSYIKKQVALGPRVPGSESHRKCGDYIISELNRHGIETIEESEGTVKIYTGEEVPMRNILARINPDNKNRILFLAHYDTRPWADNEEDPELHNTPIPGANDGGSGVGVLLEMARHLGNSAPGIGVDMLFIDVEDSGESAGFGNNDNTWCLGTQKWVENLPYPADGRPRYAVILDMVGGLNAHFHREYFSEKYAPEVVKKVWDMARKSGYGEFFLDADGGAVVDDHIVINQAGIPAIDIIESKNEGTRSFPPTWHTLEDNMNNIDPASLKAVGQTMLNLVYNEK